MHYISTRGDAPALTFTDALLAGLAADGGLYVPQTYPVLTRETMAGFAGRDYRHVAETVITPFVADDIEPAALRAMIDGAYSTFRHPAIAPLVQIDANLFVLELFHGRTLAFKDVAMQLLARLMDAALKTRGQHATIVGATSGDTGAAAIEAFRGLDNIDVVIFFPHERVSAVQRKQMTTVPGDNIHVVALKGTFDDCQAAVKALFGHRAFRDDLALSGVNSINWARVMAQIVYYFTSAVALGAPDRPISFAVPTGNFGDVLAGWIAKRMGLPIDRLVVATNSNDILVRAMDAGAYEVRAVHQTQSPSMDIQISSNFERLLFEAGGRDAAAVRQQMASLAQSGAFSVAPAVLETIRGEFDATAVDEDTTTAEIGRLWREAAYLADPHTAVGVHAGRAALARKPQVPMIVLGTAHPAKFPDATRRATGQHPQLPLHLATLMDMPERLDVLDYDMATIERFMRQRCRAAA